MIYLNDGFGGGATKFLDYEIDVVPKTCMALLFQHRILHEGAVVTSGTKYVLRSDVMYRDLPPGLFLAQDLQPPARRPVLSGDRG